MHICTTSLAEVRHGTALVELTAYSDHRRDGKDSSHDQLAAGVQRWRCPPTQTALCLVVIPQAPAAGLELACVRTKSGQAYMIMPRDSCAVESTEK